MSFHQQRHDRLREIRLARRAVALEGEIVDAELEAAIRAHGLIGALGVIVQRRYERSIEKEFLTGGVPQGADPSLPVIDIEPL